MPCEMSGRMENVEAPLVALDYIAVADSLVWLKLMIHTLAAARGARSRKFAHDWRATRIRRSESHDWRAGFLRYPARQWTVV